MKFSLKFLLFMLCGVGAVVGIMGRLFVESPETFLSVLHLVSMVGPFLLAIGTIIWVGVRGAPRRWGFVAWACILLVAPFVLQVAIALLIPTGNALQLVSTQRLIANRLPAQIDTPWVWHELERRLAGQELSREEVDAAFGELIAYMSKRPGGWNEPLAWQRDFIAAASNAKLLPKETRLRLCDAFYGTKPKVTPLQPATEGATDFQLVVNYGNVWSDQSGIETNLLWEVKQVSLDGTSMKLNNVHRFPSQWTADCVGNLTAGMHDVAIDVECAYVDSSLWLGAQPHQLPATQWPKTLKRWTTTVNVPLTVQPAPAP